MPTQITEAAKVARSGPGKILLTIITPGQGSSGYYPAETIKKAAEEKAFPRGTMGMVNHDTEQERADRPEGDLRNLIWVTLEDAYVNEDGALVAETRVLSAWRDFVEETYEFIGASISAAAQVRDTKEGRVIERLIPSPFNRADAVTVAGRGGQVSEILEAARIIESRSIIANEVTADDVRVYLSRAVRDTHSNRDNDEYAWTRDHDETYVYFDKNGKSWRQTYTRDGVNVTLTGEPEEVLRRTEYDPVATESVKSAKLHVNTEGLKEALEVVDTEVEARAEIMSRVSVEINERAPEPPAAPAGQDPSPIPAEESKKSIKEIPMAEIAEERLQLLEESHGRVPALEAKVEAAEKRADEADRRAAVAESTVRARDFAKKIITSANSELSESVVARIVDASTATIPLTENLQLDTDALTETVNKAREAEETYLAKLAKENGLGQVRGVGETKSTDVAEASDADILNELKGA